MMDTHRAGSRDFLQNIVSLLMYDQTRSTISLNMVLLMWVKLWYSTGSSAASSNISSRSGLWLLDVSGIHIPRFFEPSFPSFSSAGEDSRGL